MRIRGVAVFLSVVLVPLIILAQGNAGARKGGGGAAVPVVGGTTSVGRKVVPSEDYFECFTPFYAGEFRTALGAFQSAAKGGIRSTDGRWIDSICYHTMVGECYYQLGDLAQALDQYNSALKLYLAYQDWMLRVSFPAGLVGQSGVLKNPINWGASSRQVSVGQFPPTYLALQGRLDNQLVAQQGGVLSDPQQYPLHVKEIVRCIVVSLRRRAELLGPLCPHDPMTSTLVTACSKKLAIPGHWTQAWADVQLGMAMLGTGKLSMAASELERSLLADGQFEHPFSSAALLELGKIALNNGQFEPAVSYFMEATYSAATFGQFDVLEEAFRGAVTAHLASGRREPFAPLVPASAWASRVSVPLRASLLVLLADNLSQIGEGNQAMGVLEDARREFGRHDVASGAIGARFQFELAKVNFQNGNLAVGTKALSAAMSYQLNGGSLRLFHAGLVDSAWGNGLVRDRTADQLYSEVLREPTSKDWSISPMESISSMLAPLLAPMEHWFELNMARGEPERALEIADFVRRHRFYSSLPLGGRLLGLRWILNSPQDLLAAPALLQRQDLLAKYPKYSELERQSAQVRADIARMGILSENSDQIKAIAERYDTLHKISMSQELALHEIALRRDAADLVFPPPLNLKELKKRLSKSDAILSFFNTSNGLYAFQIGAERFEHWQIDRPAKIRSDISDLLKRWGLIDKNKVVELKELQSSEWKSIAARLLPQLMKSSRPSEWDEIQDLVLVPDGALWYCPFEALPVGQGDSTVAMLQRFRIRYVPTVSLAVGDPRRPRPQATTAVVAGRMFPKDDLQLTRDVADKLATAMPPVIRLTSKLPSSTSLIVKSCGRLIVFHDMDDSEKAPFDFSPAQVDKGKPGSALSAWFSLPWGAPEQVVFPGFHTPAESALKKGGTGDEIFLSLCGLMSTGTRTVLMSRWRVAGQSTIGLVQEFVQELPHMAASESWQRSVQLRMESELAVESEPRVRASGSATLKAEHPFFWAGYLLADTGVIPGRDNVAVAADAAPGPVNGAKGDAKNENAAGNAAIGNEAQRGADQLDPERAGIGKRNNDAKVPDAIKANGKSGKGAVRKEPVPKNNRP